MIDVYKLTAEDRGRIVKVREEELGSYQNPERRYGVMDYPEKLSEADAKAFELNYLGVVWRSPR